MTQVLNDLTEEEINFEVEEVRIKLPSGIIISGKWWGDKSVRPFVCLHGWQDNAGSFDRLIPLLPKNCSYLAVDLPGHGRSSWLPHGVPYHNLDNLNVLSYLMKEYNWDKLSIIGHSMGANVIFMYAAIFPQKIDMIISIEGLKPFSRSPSSLIATIRNSLENFMIADQRNINNSEPPTHTFDEMVERVHKSMNGSITKECAPYILRRNTMPSKMYPGKFYFSRDSRLKYSIGFNISQIVYVDLSHELKMPFLVLKAGGSMIGEENENFDEILNILKTHPHFEFHVIESSSHHMHLTEPEKIAGVIGKFIEKHKLVQSQL